MKVTQVFIPISIAVVLFMSVMTVEAAPTTSCDWEARKGRICTVDAHGRPKFSCEAGYEFPKNGNMEACNPVEWKCHVDDADPDRMVKCDSKEWTCHKIEGTIMCGLITGEFQN